MLYEFGRFQLNERTRELRLDGREVPLQPRAFDVLKYLIRNRDRVVPKDELLDAVWPDVVVSDGSLKRAVSLVRTALREGGREDAIRTYSRQGYRFDASVQVVGRNGTAAEPEPSRSPDEDARRLHAEGRWPEAAERFAEADAAQPLDAADLERWAEALHLCAKCRDAIAPLERAVAAYGAKSDHPGVARAALTLAQLLFEQSELGLARGWLRRAERILPEAPVLREHGALAGLSSRFAIADGRFDRAIELAERAVTIGRELAEIDIEVYGMSYLGMALIATGQIERGLAVHEEAAAMVLTGRASPTVSGVVFCGLIWTCRNRCDWQRAVEWNESFVRWCEEGSFDQFSGNCRLHRAEVLHHRGDINEAERAAMEAVESLPPYAQGDAWRVLGDLHLSRRELDAADVAYRRAHECGWDPQPGLARLQVLRGRAMAGLSGLERSLKEAGWADRQRYGLLLAHLIEVALAADRPKRARQALEKLERTPNLWSTSGLRAYMLGARAELRMFEGDLEEAISDLREAVRLWHRIGSPLHLVRQRLRLARAYSETGEHDAADLELSAATSALEELGVPALFQEASEVRGYCQARGR
ncbi:MAG: winged helix-turn-helix domain-containing protein [Myxococcales bacterium]